MELVNIFVIAIPFIGPVLIVLGIRKVFLAFIDYFPQETLEEPTGFKKLQ